MRDLTMDEESRIDDRVATAFGYEMDLQTATEFFNSEFKFDTFVANMAAQTFEYKMVKR